MASISTIFNTPPPRESRRPSPDRQLLVSIRGALGKIGGNVNQYAHRANLGDTPERRVLEEIRDDLRVMRDLLFRALGRKPPGDGPEAGP